MCVAIPVKVIKLCNHDLALVALGGVTKEISLSFVEGVAVGDYVIVHVGHALAKLDTDEAEATLRLMKGEAGLTGALPLAQSLDQHLSLSQ